MKNQIRYTFEVLVTKTDIAHWISRFSDFHTTLSAIIFPDFPEKKEVNSVRVQVKLRLVGVYDEL